MWAGVLLYQSRLPIMACPEYHMSITRLSFAVLFSLIALPMAHADDSKWGALALDTEQAEREPYYGVGGGETEQEAIDAAMGFCKEAGGAVCKNLVSYQQCGALAVTGLGKAGWGKAPTKDEAEKQAISGCADAACKIVVSDCNGV
jgi:Domain of unknown function (DUF4189)